MSTSPMYHAFGVRGYTHVKTEYVGGAVAVTIEESRERRRCAARGAREVRTHGHVERRFRGVPIGRKPVWIVHRLARLECRRCGVVRC